MSYHPPTPALLLQRSLSLESNNLWRNGPVVDAGGGHEAKDGALKGKAAMDYLNLAATIVTRELKEESYDCVEGFQDVSSIPRIALLLISLYTR